MALYLQNVLTAPVVGQNVVVGTGGITLGNGSISTPTLAINGSVAPGISLGRSSTYEWSVQDLSGNLRLVDFVNSRVQLTLTPGAAGLAASKFLDLLQVQAGAGQTADLFQALASDGTTKLFNVDVSGNLLFGTTNTHDVGSTGSLPRSLYAGTSLIMADAGKIGFTSDTFLLRDAANTLALRNGVNAQLARIYNTFTDVSNYERLAIGIGPQGANTWNILSEAAGTGASRTLVIGTKDGTSSLYFDTNNLDRWFVDGSTGALCGAANNTVDIGKFSGSKPRNGYFGTSVIAPVFTANVGGSTGTMNGHGTANIQTSSAGVGNGADATDDTLFTYTLPLNALNAAGKSLRVRAWGTFGATANTKAVKLWFAGTALVNSGVLTLSGKNWTIEYEVTAIDATHVSTIGSFMGDTASVQDVTVNANLAVSDLTANTSIIKVTGASTITAAASDVVGYGMKVDFSN